MPKLKILDCTFRDGGYYTDWDFDPDLVNQYLEAVESAKIDIVEIGFRLSQKTKQLGPFAYCKEEFLNDKLHRKIAIAVMVNAKDFFKKPEDIKREFIESKFSLVDIVRVAVNYDQVDKAFPICQILYDLGYTICINLMQISIAPDKDVATAATKCNQHKYLSALYIADSMGSMKPVDIVRFQDILCSEWDREIGLHAHNNQGNANANVMQAIISGYSWIDTSITGMGRGAGNAITEEVLSELGDNYDPQKIYELATGGFARLKKKHDWGPTIYYSLAAKYGIHPTYIQQLLVSNSYDNTQILQSIEKLRHYSNRRAFNDDALHGVALGCYSAETIRRNGHVKIIIPARCKSSRLPNKPLVDIAGKSLLRRVWDRCSLAMDPKNIFVATEDESIQTHCNEQSMNCIMTTPGCLTGTDRLYEAALNLDADLIINVQGDEPLVSPSDIAKIIEAHQKDPSKVYCGMCPIRSEEDFRRPSIIKIVTDENNDLLYASRAPIPTDKQGSFRNAMKQVCIYAYSRKALKLFGEHKKKTTIENIEDIEILRFLELGYPVRMVEVSDLSVGVDYPEDAEKVTSIIKEYEEIYG